MEIQLSWEDPTSGELFEPRLSAPIAFGREAGQIPPTINDEQVSPIILASKQVSRFHALITANNGQLTIEDRSANGTLINGLRLTQSSQTLNSGDTLKLGAYEITVTIESMVNNVEATEVVIGEASATEFIVPSSTIVFNPETDILEAQAIIPQEISTPGRAFPPACFAAERVSIADINAAGLPIEESDYVGLGAGMGSFVWADTMRCFGVKAEQIVILGIEQKPYGRYQRLCQNSQIPAHERLRSGSDSCPDNIWGWPGYAWRESFKEFFKGQVSSSIKHLWQVFSEPVLANTYTPKSGDVFASVDREAARIGWEKMLRYGRFRAIRKTEDGRYVIAYSRTQGDRQDHRFLITRYIHMAPGYPAIKFLPDLQAYREKYRDFKSVVNAYEEHEHVYKQLISKGGSIIVRGRGIVASRIIQRVSEIRRQNPKVTVLHLMRSPKPEGNKFGVAQRKTENQWEFQPYNWPKGTWGGDMKKRLEEGSPVERQRLLTDWGGTTTADRSDWKQIVSKGLQEGWYAIAFGKVNRVEQDDQGRLVTYLESSNIKGESKLNADFIIDSTGLDAKPSESPFLNDLVTHYSLPLNPLGRLQVANDFELVEMRNDRARMYAAGVMTLGGPYAPVDTFLGLQYAAQCAADGLARARAPKANRLNGLGSFIQWIKWATNQTP